MLVHERKPLSTGWGRRINPRPKQGMRFGEFTIPVTGNDGHTFRVVAVRTALGCWIFR